MCVAGNPGFEPERQLTASSKARFPLRFGLRSHSHFLPVFKKTPLGHLRKPCQDLKPSGVSLNQMLFPLASWTPLPLSLDGRFLVVAAGGVGFSLKIIVRLFSQKTGAAKL